MHVNFGDINLYQYINLVGFALLGGHKVASSDVPDFYINVCREITGDVAPGKNCPKESASCSNGKDMGHIVDFSKLQLVNDYTINLKYANANASCSTNITFVCPKSISQVVSS